MMTLHDARALLGGAATLHGEGGTRIGRVHTDTRTLQRGDLFVALRGERFDGHDFLPQAQAAGAAAVLAERGVAACGLPGLEVADALLALQQLAAAWRRQQGGALIAVTGSNGKTTVTQMIAAVLRAWLGPDALATKGNLNNAIGVPLTLLRLRAQPAHRVAVVELGTNHEGEIARLAALAAPTVALVNNTQREHQEFLPGLAAVARENGSVIEALPSEGVALFPADDPGTALWRQLAGSRRTRSFALHADADVRGQAHARRALEIAAAGCHHLLFVGPPGSGKTLLASRLCGILPEPSDAEALEAAAIASASGRGLDLARWRQRPFRAPHHTASAVALVGGGADPRPGEISLAHHGVLFLDELPEWSRHALEVLREPLESGSVSISRAARHCDFPARFQLVAAMNPCPCGWAGDPSGRCLCNDEMIRRYRHRLSGPLLDRIDLHVEVPRLPPTALRPEAPGGEASGRVRERVVAARALQLARAGAANAHLDQGQTQAHCRLAPRDTALLERAVDSLQLSARSLHRILRVARTIADLADSAGIETPHLTEAIGYRRLDRGSAREAA